MLRLEVITPTGSVLDVQVAGVTAPGELGAFQVLPQHLPMLTLLSGGRITYQGAKGGTGYVLVRGGVVEVRAEGHILVLSDEVQLEGELNTDRARQIQARAEKGLVNDQYLTDDALANLRKDLAYAEAVLSA